MSTAQALDPPRRGVTRPAAPVRPSAREWLREWLPLLLIVALAAAAIGWRLGARSLEDWDEAIYAQIAKEIVGSGDWLTLHWGYEPFFEKPPFLMWSTATLFSLFGVSELSARAASALSGVGVVVLVYAIGRRTYDRTTAFVAGVVLLTTHGFLTYARVGMTDAMLTFFIYLAIYAYMRVREGETRWWLAVGAATGLAVLTKSAAGVVAPGAVAVAALLDGELRSALRSRAFWGGIAIAIALVVPWHLAMYLMYGRRFLDVYFGLHLRKRTATALDGHTGDRWYYVRAVYDYSAPWFYVLPFATAMAVREAMGGRRGPRLLLVVVGTALALYTAVHTKLAWYAVPMYPAASLLVAHVVVEAWRARLGAAGGGAGVAVGPTETQAFALASLAVAGLALVLSAPLALATFTMLAGGAATAVAYVARRPRTLQVAAVALTGLFVATQIEKGGYFYETGESASARLARAARSRSTADRDPLIVYRDVSWPTPIFYSDRPAEPAESMAGLDSVVPAVGSRRLLVKKADLPAIAPRYDVRVVGEAPPLVYALISRGPPSAPRDATKEDR